MQKRINQFLFALLKLTVRDPCVLHDRLRSRVFRFIFVYKREEVERAVAHENNLAVFNLVDCRRAVFFVNDLAVTDVHRLEVILTADLYFFLSLRLECDNRIVIQIVLELD